MRARLGFLLTATALAAAGEGPAAPPADAAGIGAAAATAAGEAAPAAAAQPHDPFRGMDRNGRIPIRPWPEEPANRERWRYFPEGRLVPGNVIDRLFVSSFIAPIVYYERAVGAGGGLALTDIDFRERRRQEFLGLFASRSSEGQESYAALWQRWLERRELASGGVLQEERSLVRVRAGYNRSLTRRFYGFGPDTRKGDETSYTDETASASALLQRSLPAAGDDWVAAIGASLQHRNLFAGRIEDRPSADAAHPELAAAADGTTIAWLHPSVRFDTRDSQANPYRGWLLQAAADIAAVRDDGRDPAAIGELRATWTIPVPGLLHDSGAADRARLGPEENPPTDVIAIGAFVEQTWGDLPFADLPSLGGSNTLRGYIADRFTGRAAWHATAEWRIWTVPRGYSITDAIRIERVGVAPFVDVGTVAERATRLPRSRHHVTPGIGLRAGLERAAQFRLDIARSDERAAVTFSFGMAF